MACSWVKREQVGNKGEEEVLEGEELRVVVGDDIFSSF